MTTSGTFVKNISPHRVADLTIGTRGSPLALAQAKETRDLLMAAHKLNEEQIAIKVISTEGDRIQDKALRAFGGKGLFTKEIEEGLLDGSLDLAVHSMKDVQTRLPDGVAHCSNAKKRRCERCFY